MSKPSWQQPGYSDLADVVMNDGDITVTFANGDVIAIPDVLLGGLSLSSITASIDDEDPSEINLFAEGEPVRTISWMQLRVATDAAFAQHMRALDADESRRLGLRLKALREDRGIKQSDLASLVNMTSPQLSKIEGGAHDMRVSTVRALLRALDASFADISGPDAPGVSLKVIARYLVESGITRDAADSLLTRLPRRAISRMLESVLGLSRPALELGRLETVPLSGAVQFKAGKGKTPGDTPLLHLAQATAAAGRAATYTDAVTIPDDPREVRELVTAAGALTLPSLLEWLWLQGIPVLPMTGRGGFSAAVWNIDGPVIIIKESRDVPAFWLFDLAHELGHIARGHVATRSIIDVDAPTSGEALDSTDAQEREANEFALNLLVPDYRTLVAEVRRRSRGDYLAFKGAVAATAQSHGVNAGVLGVISAHELTDIGQHKDRWGSSINLSKLDGAGRAAAVEMAERFLRMDEANEEQRMLLEAVVLAD